MKTLHLFPFIVLLNFAKSACASCSGFGLLLQSFSLIIVATVWLLCAEAVKSYPARVIMLFTLGSSAIILFYSSLNSKDFWHRVSRRVDQKYKDCSLILIRKKSSFHRLKHIPRYRTNLNPAYNKTEIKENLILFLTITE